MSIVQSCQLIFFLNCKWHTELAFCLWTQRNDSLWPTSQQSDEQTSALIDRNDLNSTDWGRAELISHKKDCCCWEFVDFFLVVKNTDSISRQGRIAKWNRYTNGRLGIFHLLLVICQRVTLWIFCEFGSILFTLRLKLYALCICNAK